MAKASKTVVMKASKDSIMSVLKDYESYIDFMDGVSSVEVKSRDGSHVKVTYGLNIIKKFSYTIDLTEAENELSWVLDSGDLFSTNSGSWKLKDLGDGTTEVDYSVEVDIKVKMIGTGMIVKKLTEVQLPIMLKAVEQRAKSK